MYFMIKLKLNFNSNEEENTNNVCNKNQDSPKQDKASMLNILESPLKTIKISKNQLKISVSEQKGC